MNASHVPASPEWLPFVNITEETIPGGAVVEPAGGYDALGRIRVRKCTEDDSFAVYFNSPMAVSWGSPGLPDELKPGGLCRTAWPLAAAAVHPDDLAGYAPRVAAGTQAGDWYLRLGQSGFLFLDDLVDGAANAMPDPLATSGTGFYPTCEGGGSGSGSGSGSGLPPEYVVWYTNYLHIGAVAVSIGESLAPGQLVGYIATHEGGAHLHFALGDGKPLVMPGYLVPIAGKTLPITDWLGYPVAGTRAGCERGSMGDPEFTLAQFLYIRSVFASPVRGPGWSSFVSSPFHCDYDFHAVDLAWAPIADQRESGQPVYNAIGGTDVITTVESVRRHPRVGYAVLLRHQRACVEDPDETTDAHDQTINLQFGGPGGGGTTIVNPPAGTPLAHRPGAFAPVTRLCLGRLPELSVVGANDADGLWKYMQLDPEQFEWHRGRIRIKPFLLGGIGTSDEVAPGETALVPITVERTSVTVPAGMLITETQCSPPATTCCDGPTIPCPNFDPIVPVSVTGPFAFNCGLFTLTGELAWDNGQGWYEGFLQGAIDQQGFLADAQLWSDDSQEPPQWVLSLQFVGVNDTLLTEVDIPLVALGDGSVLTGSATVDRETCDGIITAEVGQPCPGDGSGSGSGSGGSDTFFLEGCPDAYPRSFNAVWASFTGNCNCFGGAFLMSWNGIDRWTGTFNGCASPVTVSLVLVGSTPTSPITYIWRPILTATGYTFSTGDVPTSCGLVPFGTGSITVTGSCTGATQLVFEVL